ncbi:MAG: barstar family protein [Eubacteriales bacterium]
MNYLGEVHKIIKDELDSPDYYGENWYAFWDCLTDMACNPIHMVYYENSDNHRIWWLSLLFL